MTIGNAAARSTVQSVSRAIDILEIVADAGRALGISEIAQLCHLPMPTIHRLLRTLMAHGYVDQTPRRHYVLGSRLFSLSCRASRALDLTFQPIIEKTSRELDEAIAIATLDQDTAHYVAYTSLPHSGTLDAEPGAQLPLHATGAGKALLAAMPPAQTKSTLARIKLPSYTSKTVTESRMLLREIAIVRERGYAIDDGEYEPSVRSVAVSVPGDHYLAVAALAPAERITGRRTENEIVPLLRSCARVISNGLKRQGGDRKL